MRFGECLSVQQRRVERLVLGWMLLCSVSLVHSVVERPCTSEGECIIY